MTARPDPDPTRDASAQGFDDPTRDIRLPPAPGSPPVALRPEWSSYAPHPAEPDAGASGLPAGSIAPPDAPPRLIDQPTDELEQPTPRPRDRTLQFGDGAGFPRPAPTPVSPDPVVRSRRWPWVLLALLPIVVIVGSGIWLFVLLSGH
jgi:hypothetical protein